MSRTMFDACNPAHIPGDAAMVAGYIDGQCAWPTAAWARFPNARKIRIATNPSTDDGDVIDVERGDATPDTAAGWLAMRRAAGRNPSLYCSVANMATVRARLAAHGIAAPPFWVAHYGVAPVIPAGAVALQYANEHPPGCDTSVVADYWPGIDPAPPTPQPKGARMFTIINFGPQEGVYLLYDDHALVGVYSEPDVTELARLSSCRGQISLAPQMLARFQAAAAAHAPMAAAATVAAPEAPAA